MTQSEKLRNNINQHKVKNTDSKSNDIQIFDISKQVLRKLNELYQHENIHFVLEKVITLDKIINQTPWFSKQYYNILQSRRIEPDGGVIYMIDNNNQEYPVLFSEIKRQGTNRSRLLEGEPHQAVGNSIERAGKNLSFLSLLMNKEKIFPSVIFASGSDFAFELLEEKTTKPWYQDLGPILNVDLSMCNTPKQKARFVDARIKKFIEANKSYLELPKERIDITNKIFNLRYAQSDVGTVLAKVFGLTHGFPINQINIEKDSNGSYGTSFFAREEPWSDTEMFDIMLNIAQKSVAYYKKQ